MLTERDQGLKEGNATNPEPKGKKGKDLMPLERLLGTDKRREREERRDRLTANENGKDPIGLEEKKQSMEWRKVRKLVRVVQRIPGV